MAGDESVFLRAKDRSYKGLTEDEQKEWSGPFYFIQAADPQLGLMKAWRIGDCDSGGDENIFLTQTQRCPFREEQVKDLKEALRGSDPDIPLVFVSGNHDLGNIPTPESVEQFCRDWGDDYFSFWVGGVLCLVLNSQFFFDSSGCPELMEAHEVWLESQLQKAIHTPSRHVLVFQHIPLFLHKPDEEDDYFNLQKGIRERLIQRFKQAGVKAVFSGHYHRNAGGCYDGLDMVVSSAVGCQLGDDFHGVRVVIVTEDDIIHRYHSLDQLTERGMDEDLKKLLV
ncbi:serine/threonine-protein phosphatase CPPED1-like [Sinocyclocheilus grahami]|uniref:serine/threonine-protein phosphatase CPPED1-like n=1 Tax=Sinocyclocheilus grahami TaxID=75366 RepID=UPI0007ACAC6D|nr:PREDICTED: serine/threonine-protein phosphatase CPPED1-like [Sinocyclocheilus grahami]